MIFESAELEREVDPPGCQYFELFVSGDLSSCFFQIFGSDEFRFSLHLISITQTPVASLFVLGIAVLSGERSGAHGFSQEHEFLFDLLNFFFQAIYFLILNHNIMYMLLMEEAQ